MKCNLKCNRKMMWVMVLVALALGQAGGQILTGEQVKKIAPNSFFFSGQSAPVQLARTAEKARSRGAAAVVGPRAQLDVDRVVERRLGGVEGGTAPGSGPGAARLAGLIAFASCS